MNRPFTFFILLLLAVGGSVSTTQAQISEVGLRINSFRFNQADRAETVDSITINQPIRSGNINFAGFVHLDKGSYYHRYHLGVSRTSFRQENYNSIQGEDGSDFSKSTTLGLAAGFEIGKSWSFWKRFRVQAGLRSIIGKDIRNRRFSSNPRVDFQGNIDGAYEANTVRGGAFSLSGAMVFRPEVKICDRLLLGLELRYGLALRYLNSSYTRESREIDGAGNELSSWSINFKQTHFGISKTSLNTPFLNITYTLGKSN